MLVVVRKDTREFQKIEQTLLEAVADYASISLVNARLFRAVNEAMQSSRERGETTEYSTGVDPQHHG